MTEQEMIAEQDVLRERMVLHGCLAASDIKTVAGVDLAYWQRDNEELGVCCIEVLDTVSGEIIDSQSHSGRIAVPYIPGLLAFREVPLVLAAAKKLCRPPDIYMFDGNGYLHPRHMGLATQAGILLEKPSIGVAKTFFRVGDTGYLMPESAAGSYTNIIVNGEVCGRALRTHDGVKPVFVSVGNGIDLETATQITLRTVDRCSHIPVPTRLADLATREMRAKLRGAAI